MGLKDLLQKGVDAVKDATGIQENAPQGADGEAAVDPKKVCPVCGSKMGLLSKFKLADNCHVCSTCYHKMPACYLGHGAWTTVEYMKKVVAYREQNPDPIVWNTKFTATYSLGDFYVDEKKLLFAISGHKKKPEIDTPVYHFAWLVSADIDFHKVIAHDNGTIQGDSYLTVKYLPRMDIPTPPFEMMKPVPLEARVQVEDMAYFNTKENLIGTKIKYSMPPSSKRLLERIAEWKAADTTEVKFFV